MPKIFFVLLFVLVFPWAAVVGEAQSSKIETSVDEMIETHRLRFGIFRIQPKLIFASGYDSDTLSTPLNEKPDYYFSAGPGASIGLKLGRRAFLVLDEDITFVYYRELEELRDIYNTTSARFVTGGTRFLFEAGGKYEQKKARLDYEFDEPLQQENAVGRAELSVLIRTTTDLKFHGQATQALYESIDGTQSSRFGPPDNRTREVGAGVEQLVGSNLRLLAETTFGTVEFLENSLGNSVTNESDYWRVVTGFTVEGEKLKGEARVGYSATERTPLAAGDSFKDLFMNVDLDYSFRRTVTLGALLRRQRQVSAFLVDDFRLTTEGGIKGSVPLVRRFFTDAQLTFGKNEYGDASTLFGEVIERDRYRVIDAGVNFELQRQLILRAGISHIDRDASIPILNRDRLTFNVSLSLRPEKSR